MSTGRDIVEASFRLLRVLGVGESLDAEDAKVGIVALNRMIHGWKLKGADTEHTDIDLTDTFPLSAEYEDATALLLAKRLSAQYPFASNLDAVEIDDAWRLIHAAYSTLPTATIDDGLKRLPSQYWGYGQRRW